MTDITSEKQVCTITEMAGKLNLSRVRFYQLQRSGIMPLPVYCIHSKRPFYTFSLQQLCLTVRKTGIGINGQPVIFYSKKTNIYDLQCPVKADPVDAMTKRIHHALMQSGKTIPFQVIKQTVLERHPDGVANEKEIGVMIRNLHREADKE